jgi:hypothetical protein
MDSMGLIMLSLVLVSKLVTTTAWSHYNLHLMAGRLAPASAVAILKRV